MSHIHDRRWFLSRIGSAGALLAGSSWLPGFGYAQTSGRARAIIDQRYYRSDLDRRVLGAFLEHLGRAIYTGVYDPDNALSDSRGFRRDVIDEIRQLGVPIIRYPGGNFVSGYHWQDGVGPKDQRPTVLERAWNSLEPNQFGTAAAATPMVVDSSRRICSRNSTISRMRCWLAASSTRCSGSPSERVSPASHRSST